MINLPPHVIPPQLIDLPPQLTWAYLTAHAEAHAQLLFAAARAFAAAHGLSF